MVLFNHKALQKFFRENIGWNPPKNFGGFHPMFSHLQLSTTARTTVHMERFTRLNSLVNLSMFTVVLAVVDVSMF